MKIKVLNKEELIFEILHSKKKGIKIKTVEGDCLNCLLHNSCSKGLRAVCVEIAVYVNRMNHLNINLPLRHFILCQV